MADGNHNAGRVRRFLLIGLFEKQYLSTTWPWEGWL
jgi:hypothetical protein